MKTNSNKDDNGYDEDDVKAHDDVKTNIVPTKNGKKGVKITNGSKQRGQNMYMYRGCGLKEGK
jgi:hypothetical protein